jgi:hypothetical protein
MTPVRVKQIIGCPNRAVPHFVVQRLPLSGSFDTSALRVAASARAFRSLPSFAGRAAVLAVSGRRTSAFLMSTFEFSRSRHGLSSDTQALGSRPA